MVNILPSEIKRMLAKVDLKAPVGPRDYLMLVFAYNTGLRVSELAALNVSHVAHDGQPRETLHVLPGMAKYHKGRIVPLNATAQKAVAKLLAFNRARGFSTHPDAPLFVTKKHQRLSVRGIQWLVADLRVKAGLDVQATPHSFRHAYASQIVENTNDLVAVKELLGHERLTSTQVYVHANRQRLIRATDSLTRST